MASKISGTAGALGAEVIKLSNRLLRFRCVSEEIRVVFADRTDWMDNYSFPWAAYHDLMACCIVGLDKRPCMRLVGIEETLCQSIAKLVMRAAEDPAKKA